MVLYTVLEPPDFENTNTERQCVNFDTLVLEPAIFQLVFDFLPIIINYFIVLDLLPLLFCRLCGDHNQPASVL